MTERELFLKLIPMIAEMTVRSRKLSDRDYQDWRQQALEAAPESSRGFAESVLTVIDSLRYEDREGCRDIQKQNIFFAIHKKDSVIQRIGKSAVFQPRVKFRGGSIKWYEEQTKY